MTDTHAVDLDKLRSKLTNLVAVAEDHADPVEIRHILNDETTSIIEELEETPEVTPESQSSDETSDCSETGDIEEHIAIPLEKDNVVQILGIDENTNSVVSQEFAPDYTLSLAERVRLLTTAWRHSEYHDATREHDYIHCVQEFNTVVETWNDDALYDNDEPVKRLIAELEAKITELQNTDGLGRDTTAVIDNCITQVETEITREKTRINNEKHPDDAVTLIIEYEDTSDEKYDNPDDDKNVVGGIIIDNESDSKKIRRAHDNLRDHTEIRHTTRETAEQFLQLNGVEVLY